MIGHVLSHNITEVRKLLAAAFDDVGLVALCQDEFPDLCESLGRVAGGDGGGKERKAVRRGRRGGPRRGPAGLPRALRRGKRVPRARRRRVAFSSVADPQGQAASRAWPAANFLERGRAASRSRRHAGM